MFFLHLLGGAYVSVGILAVLIGVTTIGAGLFRKDIDEAGVGFLILASAPLWPLAVAGWWLRDAADMREENRLRRRLAETREERKLIELRAQVELEETRTSVTFNQFVEGKLLP